MDDILKYNEKLNISTAKYIFKALCDYEDLIARTKESPENKICIVFLFSGTKPDCEYEICRLIKEKIPESIISVILVDINHPEKDSIYITKKEEYGIKDISPQNFDILNHLHKIKPNRFKPNTYIIGIHPQHNSLTTKILNRSVSPYIMRNYTSNEIKNKLGMYEFFDTCWKNKKVLYAFRGNPEYYPGDNINNLSLDTIVFKPPIVVIFCSTEEDTYKNIQTIFEKGKSIFNLPKNDDGTLQFHNMTVKNNSTYVYNSCKPDQSAGYKKQHSKTKKTKFKIKYNKLRLKNTKTKQKKCCKWCGGKYWGNSMKCEIGVYPKCKTSGCKK